MKMVFILFKYFLFPVICHLKFYSSIVYILSKHSFFTIKIGFEHFEHFEHFPQHFTFPRIFKGFHSSFYLKNNIETVCIKV